MKRLSNQQLIEKIFQRINSEAELSAAISSSELSDLAKQLILEAKDTAKNFNLPNEAYLRQGAKQ